MSMVRTKEVTSRIMSKIRSKNTKPEIALRKELCRKKLRYRLNYRKLPGSPDIVFTKKKVVVFIDGDFWHGHNWRLRKLKSRSAEFSANKRTYWLQKINSNIQRDKRNNFQLREMGYKVLRYWESDVLIRSDRIANQIVGIIHS